MNSTNKLMCVLAHPDDESLGFGGVIAKYAAQGIDVSLIMATRGQKGWKGKKEDYPGPEALGDIRTKELQAASHILGIKQIHFLDHMDGELDQVEPQEVIRKIAWQIRSIKPQVILTFGPEGNYGHPDHIAISQFACAAVLQAANSQYQTNSLAPQCISKLYYLADTKGLVHEYKKVFGGLTMQVDDVKRQFLGWEEWAITTKIDVSDYIDIVKKAITYHKSQLHNYEKLINLPEVKWQKIFGQQSFYRAYSLVNGGREVETDLFAGLGEKSYKPH